MYQFTSLVESERVEMRFKERGLGEQILFCQVTQQHIMFLRPYYKVGFPTANGNLQYSPLFLPPLFGSKTHGQSNSKTAVNGIYRKR